MDLFFLCLALIIAPLTACPIRFSDGYVLPQIGVGYIFIALSSIFFISRGIVPVNTSALLGGLFLVYFILTGTWSTVPHNSITDIPLIFISVMLFIITSTLYTINSSYMVFVSLSVFCVSMLTCCYGIGQRFLIDPFFPQRLNSREAELKDSPKEHMPKMFKNKKWADSRVISTLGNTNFAAGFFCSTLPFLVFLSIEVNAWFFISVAFCVVSILVTESRAGVLSLAVAVIVFLLLAAKSGLMLDFYLRVIVGMRPEVLTLVLVVITYLGIEFLIRTRNLWPKFTEDNDINNFLDIENTHQDHPVAHLRYRFRYWLGAWHLIKKRLLCGFGLRTYRKEIYEAQAELNTKDGGKFLGYGYQTPQPRECHNDFIEYFVEGGIPGGLLFLSVIGAVFYGFYLVEMTLLNIALMASISCILVNAFFFFPLRLGSSAMMFWGSLALLEGVNGTIKVLPITFAPIVIVFFIALLAALFYEGVYKPNMSNYFFSRFGMADKPRKKEEMLNKCMGLRPYDSLPRTHAVIGYAGNYPEVAIGHSEVLHQHFDGMSPAWIMMFNLGIVNASNKRWGMAARTFERSLYYYPAFEPSRQELGRMWHLAPFPRGGIILKKISEEGIAVLGSLKQETEKLKMRLSLEAERIKANLNSIQAESISVIQTERLKLNAPIDWAFDIEENLFISPLSKPEGKTLVFVGVARVPVLLPNAMVSEMPQPVNNS